jgi:hypothetical protein
VLIAAGGPMPRRHGSVAAALLRASHAINAGTPASSAEPLTVEDKDLVLDLRSRRILTMSVKGDRRRQRNATEPGTVSAWIAHHSGPPRQRVNPEYQTEPSRSAGKFEDSDATEDTGGCP